MKQPQLFVVFLIGILVGSALTLVISNRDSKSPLTQETIDKISSIHNKVSNLTPEVALMKDSIAKTQQSSPDATAEIGAFEKDMSESNFQAAYDDLLAAMRISPESEKVFAACVKYIHAAASNTKDDGANLAQDVYQRAANLIPFLPLAQIKEARLVHTQIGDDLFGSKGDKSSEDPLLEVESLLAAGRRPNLPLNARSRLLQEVDAELGNQAKRFATMTLTANEESEFWDRWEKTKAQHESAQRELLAALYDGEVKPLLTAWGKRVAEISEQAAKTGVDGIRACNEQISILIADGERLNRDLSGYLEAAVPGAIADNKINGPEKHLAPLARLREWNYNRWTIAMVERVGKSEGSRLDKLKSLSVIDENRLAPYPSQSLSDAWRKDFDACSTEDKVRATKLRIMKDFQP
jgi:hypothetical protein